MPTINNVDMKTYKRCSVEFTSTSEDELCIRFSGSTLEGGNYSFGPMLFTYESNYKANLLIPEAIADWFGSSQLFIMKEIT